MTKDWKQARTVKLLVTSPSQFEVVDLCVRKWWMKWVRKLTDPVTSSRAFGTVMHGVIERYLSADDLGRKNGVLVDLYPEGWTKAVNRFNPAEVEGEVTPAEADIIKRLISAAIQEGVLERTFDRVIEHGFRETIIPGVQITGYIDMMDRSGITDHKSIKKMRYAKSREKLKEDIQLRIYAWFWFKLMGEEAPASVILRHNQFCKDPDDLRVRKTEADVTKEDIDAFWIELTEKARQMANFRSDTKNFNTWSDLPAPRTGADACNAYGGCAFRSICSGQESEEQYEERISRWGALQESIVNNTNTPPQENPMSLLDRLNALSASNVHVSGTVTTAAPVAINPPAPVPAPVTEVVPVASVPLVRPLAAGLVPTAVPTPQPAPTPAPGQLGMIGGNPTPLPVPQPAPGPAQAPNNPPGLFKASTQPNAVPWAIDGCGACKGWGFNSRGGPCQICRVNGKKTTPPLPDPDTFTLTNQGDGSIMWQSRTNPDYVGVSPYSSSAGVIVVAEAKTAPVPAPVNTFLQAANERQATTQPVQVVPQPAPAPAPTLAPTPTPTPVADPTPATQEDTEAAAKRRGRPKKGFILLNGYVTKGEERLNSGRGVHHLTDVLRKYGAMLAEQYIAAGKLKPGQGYYDMNAFDRRDELAKVAEQIAETFGADLAVADLAYATPDLKALFEALDPWCGMRLVGSRGPG